MTDIDVGGACIYQPDSTGDDKTCIEKNNPANASGTITNVCLWIVGPAVSGWYVGVFYCVSGTIYHCRSAHGPFTPSSGQNDIPVNLKIEAGDYIGVYCPSTYPLAAAIRRTRSGLRGRFVDGNHCIVDDEALFFTGPQETYSLYGTGIEHAPPPMPATVSVTATSTIPLWMWDEDGIAKIPCTRNNPVKVGMAFEIAVSEEGENNKTTIVTPHVDTPESKTISFNITLSDPLTPMHLRGTYIGNVIVNGGAGTIHVNLTSFSPSQVTITFDTKKEDGSTLTGVDVWINDVKKGTT